MCRGNLEDRTGPDRRNAAAARRAIVAAAVLCLGGCVSTPQGEGTSAPRESAATPIATIDRPSTRPSTAALDGSRSAEAVRRAFVDRGPGLRAANSTRKSLQAGTIVVTFTVAPAGEVVECRIVSTDFQDPEFNAAVVAEVWRLRLEPVATGEFTDPAYPIAFAARDDASLVGSPVPAGGP